jgi:3'-phosphoadenosine 5'-phosphosulfate (PAPS) 3'-phosphatase
MAKLRLLKTGHGDLCLAEWDQARPETITEAAGAFAEHFTPGRLAFRLDGPGRTSPIRAFDATAPEILLVPAIQGG